LPIVVEIMKRREEELLEAIHRLSEKTEGFTNPRLILIGGYALRAFIKFSRSFFEGYCEFLCAPRMENLPTLSNVASIVYNKASLF
jgi:hypothetical protein